ncbi:MAG: glutamate racemase [Verrucomicrobia bacterium]|nr:glutamate racemase [Verrucomicrobiota bacterium]
MPLGVFDSGIGGLTVVKELRATFPRRDILYVGDTARVPYGNKSAETVKAFSREIISFLKGKGADRIVVACNTASALAVESLRSSVGLPLHGMIESGVIAALAAEGEGPVGVIGTSATISSGAYQQALGKARPGLKVFAQATPLLVPLVEEGWLEGEVTEKVVREYLEPLMREKIRVLVLGCTHYPLLKPVFAKVLGAEVKLVDSSEACAESLRGSEEKISEKGKLKIFLTDEPGPFLGRVESFLGEGTVGSIERIHLP